MESLRMSYKLKPLEAALVAIYILGVNTPSFAAEEPTLETVVISAQKRSEKIQSVPVSVTLLSGEMVDRQGVTSLADLSRSSASLEFGAPNAAVGGGGFVRGIGTNSVSNTAQASVGVVLDGVVMGNTNISSVFDVDRIEILKGPQGTLFGNSVSAGVMSLSTKAPNPKKKSLEISTEISAKSFGSEFGRKVLRGALNIPLSETSAIRLAVHQNNDEGVNENIWLGTKTVTNDNGMRLRYVAHPTDTLTVNVIADYNQNNTNGNAALAYRTAPAGSPLALALAECGVQASPSNTTTCGTVADLRYINDKGISAQIDKEIGEHTLTSITSFRTNHTVDRLDVQSIPKEIVSKYLPIFGIISGGANGVQTYDRKQFSQELRLASSQNKHFEYVAGLFFQNYKLDMIHPNYFAADFGGGPFALSYTQTYHVESSDFAPFGQATYYLTPDWRLIAGARVTHSKVSEIATDPTQNPNSGSLSTTATKFSYRLGVQHDLSATSMAYLSLATGYKGPQISDATPGGLFVVKPEIPTSLEFGFKTSVFNNRLAINADIFYTKVKDYQGQACSVSPNGGTVDCLPANVPEVITQGIELDIFGRLFAGFTLNASAIYNPTKYPMNYLSADGTNLGGTQLTRSSKFKMTLSGEYTYAVNDSYYLTLGADTVYRSKIAIYPSASPDVVIPAGWITNLRIGLHSDQDWSISLFGRNIGRERLPRELFPTPFQPGGMWQILDASAKRLVGIQFDAKF